MGVQFTPPNPDNYVVGKGVLYIADFPGAGSPSWTHMGNCPSVEIEQSIERLPHFSSMASLKYKDKNPVVQTEYMINFDCDELAAANLRVWLGATESGTSLYAMQDVNKEYAVKFVSANPIGPDYVWTFHKCTIGANGAAPLIGDEYMQLSFTADGLADTANNASSPYFDVVRVTTTTTSSTTTTAP